MGHMPLKSENQVAFTYYFIYYERNFPGQNKVEVSYEELNTNKLHEAMLITQVHTGSLPPVLCFNHLIVAQFCYWYRFKTFPPFHTGPCWFSSAWDLFCCVWCLGGGVFRKKEILILGNIHIVYYYFKHFVEIITYVTRRRNNWNNHHILKTDNIMM